MSRVFWDTNLFIYLVEDKGTSADRVQSIRERMLARTDQLLTSVLTLGEVLVKPTANDRTDLIKTYEALLASGVELVTFDSSCARRYAAIRGSGRIKAPDAIQLACAASAGVDLFITNDDRLSKAVVPGVQFITSLERAFL